MTDRRIGGRVVTLTEFLLARIAEDEADHYPYQPSDWGDFDTPVGGCLPCDVVPPGRCRVLAECEVKRRIVEWHKSWPVLVQSPPSFDRMDGDDLNSVTFRASQQMAWLTEQEYRTRFGSEPPTAPVLALLALPYADHPDYREEWRP